MLHFTYFYEMAQIELIPFIPETASFRIWHPKEFSVHEDAYGIVSVTTPENDISLTLSSYHASENITEKMLTGFFSERTESYAPVSAFKKVMNDNRIWLEREFTKNNIYWIWWALSYSNAIILASVNNIKALNDQELHLYRFMIHHIEVYADCSEE